MTEAQLRTWHDEQASLLNRVQLAALSKRFQYWPDASPLPPLLAALDTPHECLATACEIHAAHGFGVVVGWAASDSHEQPVVHAWNITEKGEVIDTAEARRTATGYLGTVLTTEETAFFRGRNPYRRSR